MVRLTLLFKRLLLLLMIYQISRLIFLFVNYGYFESASFTGILMAFVTGLRFDLTVILMINFIFCLLHLVPTRLFFTNGMQTFLKYLFFISNIPFILLNCVDLEYFKYQGKRTTADLFDLFGMGEDMQNTIPQMAKDFWYVLLVFVLLSILLIYGYGQIRNKIKMPQTRYGIADWFVALLLGGLLILGARGGMQYKTLNIMSAARLSSPALVPLVLNTPFTVIRTYGKEPVEEKIYMSHEEALTYFNPHHHFQKQAPFKNQNVVIIILESFSSEYIGALNGGHGYTPFLDSLIGESLTFTRAFANAKKSIDGIPAIIASLPTLMPASYVSSPYNGNRLQSIAGILKSKNYSSAFFHGGNNGTMNFDNFTMITGFEKYYGRREYPGDDYDGNWGVFDEPFYYFFIDKCNGMKQPFVNVFFTLSSHHPYSIPAKQKGRFPKGSLPIHESIGYADFALQQFFGKAKQAPWFSNTLFVITADHTGPAERPEYNTSLGHYCIPILFYHPGDSLRGISARVTQQTDIIPGILDYLNYNEPFSAFGNSLFDTSNTPFAVNYNGTIFQAVDNDHLIQFDGDEPVAAFRYESDSLLINNVVSPNDPQQQHLLKTLQSVLQHYSTGMIRNELTPP